MRLLPEISGSPVLNARVAKLEECSGPGHAGGTASTTIWKSILIQHGDSFLHCRHKLCGEDDCRVLFGRNFSHRLQRAKLKRHGMLCDDVGCLAELH